MKKFLAVLLSPGMVMALVCTTSAAGADWQAGGGANWQKVMAAAKQEGRVAVAGPPQLAVMAQGFLRDTGIQVDYLSGETRTTSSRVGREVRAGNVTIDAFFTGVVELPLVKEGFFEDEKARLILPGVTDMRNWAGGELKWVDNTKRFMLATHAYVSTIPVYNTNIVKPGEFTSWKDLLKPQFKGKIVAYDPRAGGPGQASSTYIATQFGIDFLKALYLGQGVVYSLDSRQMADWITKAQYAVGLGVLTPDYMKFRDAGIKHIAPAILKDGPGTLSSGFSVILLPKGAPHPNSATVFLNWFASQPGQEIFSRAYDTPSRRTDVHIETIPEHVIPKAGVKYQDQYNEDWFMNRREAVTKEVIEVLGGK